jgi:hypothetical protein
MKHLLFVGWPGALHIIQFKGSGYNVSGWLKSKYKTLNKKPETFITLH